uniref:Uncharacterized protein n=1 Tax=viral metagenome TaxID=1070528 RepID=A0A6M3KE97_9ZZZZ
MKTQKQITKEIKALKTVRPNVRPRNMFGDDNLAALNAQIKVLEENLNRDRIHDAYDHVDSSEHILESALDARQWINDEEDEDCEGLACEWPLKE